MRPWVGPALLAAAALLLAPASLAQRAAGSLSNPSFETGGLASWTVVEQTLTQPIWSVRPMWQRPSRRRARLIPHRWATPSSRPGKSLGMRRF